MTPPDAVGSDDLVEQLWQRFQSLASQRVRVLEAYAALRRQGRDDADLREQAVAAAHSLQGGLGSYRRPAGSRLAEACTAALHTEGGSAAELVLLTAELRAVVGP